MPLISVVIPALNEEQQLPRALASLRRQNVDAEYEIIVVDNGSTDRTAEVARAGGARVVSSASRGVVNARQAGLEAAQGVFVVQADADTDYPVDWLACIKHLFVQHPEAVAVAGCFRYREPKKFERAEWIMRNLANRGSQAFTGKLLMVSGANLSYYRRALLACGGYRQNAFSPDQYDLTARLSKQGGIIYDQRLIVITSARRVQRSTLVIGMIFMRFVMSLHLNIFKFFFVDQFRDWIPSSDLHPRPVKVLKASASITFTLALTFLTLWVYFAISNLPTPFNISLP